MEITEQDSSHIGLPTDMKRRVALICCAKALSKPADPGDGNWWLQIEDQVLGYWPFSLFSHLKDSATMIEWGGEIVDSRTGGEHTATGMGSGHFPREGFGKAGYFRNIQIVDGFNKLVEPAQLATFTSQSSCYDIRSDHGGAWKTYFYYGGPGRSPSCP
ncbi:hypothetical protein OIU77_016260 [Salix suchowensis]|uniref:Neprosin PEP catalytic domain-containing protein n=1 Tax=Salix suchowensis TaxID=1278906 RepID=A0ABQ8ZJR7_9ROSI|nr:hypothetical protein OIU77_016260 [Salix suchowensis]